MAKFEAVFSLGAWNKNNNNYMMKKFEYFWAFCNRRSSQEIDFQATVMGQIESNPVKQQPGSVFSHLLAF